MKDNHNYVTDISPEHFRFKTPDDKMICLEPFKGFLKASFLSLETSPKYIKIPNDKFQEFAFTLLSKRFMAQIYPLIDFSNQNISMCNDVSFGDLYRITFVGIDFFTERPCGIVQFLKDEDLPEFIDYIDNIRKSLKLEV